MKKALFLLLAILLISQYYCDDELDDGECDKENVSKASECEKLKPGDYYKCCYYKTKLKKDGKEETRTGCEPLTKGEYDKIKDYIKESENSAKAAGYSADVSVDCSSNYIIISILSLLLLFL